MADMTDAEQARENRKYTLIGVIVTIIAAIAIIGAAIAIVHANRAKNISDESKSKAAFSRIADKPAHVAVDGALVYDRRGFEKDPVDHRGFQRRPGRQSGRRVHGHELPRVRHHREHARGHVLEPIEERQDPASHPHRVVPRQHEQR
jgi:hypothetical protein